MISLPSYWHTNPDSDRQQRIPLALVNFQGWQQYRYDRLLALWSNGITEFEPIKCVGYRLGDNVWYGLSDGNHRCSFMSDQNVDVISADIGGYYDIDVSQFVIHAARYELHQIKSEHLLLIAELEPDLIAELKTLGVREIHSLNGGGED
ncbi:hypothetical protein [Photobacterium leiognathi]|uniref:hypothetical protein n=1 Tax=Photobacterium leiognathi TaxID=553611 RepID=UPI002980AB31|nr:hypothetical protein [Photobacterium leiognathi]